MEFCAKFDGKSAILDSMDDSEYIRVFPEAEKSVNLRNDAVKLAKAGNFNNAITLALAITKLNFALNLIFKDEALLEILYWICEAK